MQRGKRKLPAKNLSYVIFFCTRMDDPCGIGKVLDSTAELFCRKFFFGAATPASKGPLKCVSECHKVLADVLFLHQTDTYPPLAPHVDAKRAIKRGCPEGTDQTTAIN